MQYLGQRPTLRYLNLAVIQITAGVVALQGLICSLEGTPGTPAVPSRHVAVQQ